MRNWLKYYKPGTEEYRPEYGLYISAIIQRFMRENMVRLIDLVGQYTVVSQVPSSTRVGPHPLSYIMGGESVFGAPVKDLLQRGDGELGHRIMSDSAFIATDVSGERVLLIDDVYTTGAHAQSAASALSDAGAVVPAILVVARRINPDFNITARELWARQQLIRYDFGTALRWLRL